MGDVSNKEVIEALTRYFLKQSKEELAYALSALFVDFNRLANWDKLSEKEQLCFKARMQLNAASLSDFMKNGPKGDLKVHKLNSDEL